MTTFPQRGPSPQHSFQHHLTKSSISAISRPCADACNAMPVIPGSLLDEHLHDETCRGGDHFHTISPNTDWEVCLAHAEKLGIGTRRYELVTIK